MLAHGSGKTAETHPLTRARARSRARTVSLLSSRLLRQPAPLAHEKSFYTMLPEVSLRIPGSNRARIEALPQATTGACGRGEGESGKQACTAGAGSMKLLRSALFAAAHGGNAWLLRPLARPTGVCVHARRVPRDAAPSSRRAWGSRSGHGSRRLPPPASLGDAGGASTTLSAGGGGLTALKNKVTLPAAPPAPVCGHVSMARRHRLRGVGCAAASRAGAPRCPLPADGPSGVQGAAGAAGGPGRPG